MRLSWTKTKYSVSYYVQKTVYVNGKNKSMVVKRLGSEKYICDTYGVTDAKAWAKEQVALMNQAEKEQSAPVTINFFPSKDLPANQQRSFNGGYLFLQSIYYQLGLHKIYRALSVLAKESDYIQSRLFKNSLQLAKRKTGVIYYDCTNFYFEIEQAEDDKQYGVSKEKRPLPIVEMGFFMDADGIPLAFSIYPGNRNEQLSLIPLEKRLLTDFDLSKFVVCTDAGLSSSSNRKFNDDIEGSRSFITTQSVKKTEETFERLGTECRRMAACRGNPHTGTETEMISSV